MRTLSLMGIAMQPAQQIVLEITPARPGVQEEDDERRKKDAEDVFDILYGSLPLGTMAELRDRFLERVPARPAGE